MTSILTFLLLLSISAIHSFPSSNHHHLLASIGIHCEVPTARNSLRRSLAGISTSKAHVNGTNTTTAPAHVNGTNTTTAPAHVNGTNTTTAPAPNPAKKNHNKKHKHRVRNWIIGFVVGAVCGIVSGLLATLLYRFLRNCIRGSYKKTKGGLSIFSSMIKTEDLTFLEHDEALAALEVIGRGGCGEVYRAELQSTPGKIIAVKKITKRSTVGEPTEDESCLLDKWTKQIRAEILTVGRIRHRNLLSLLAHKARPDSHFLIYEFMKNGSLHDLIKQSSQGLRELDWSTRLKIAKGIAAGLEYLHIIHKPNIIHRDLKPANILIDDNMEARIADFGFAKEIPDANTHMTSSNVAGTYGYIAPEYHQTFKFTVKCDIYSFGVILGAIVMGKFPSDEFFQDTEEVSLVKWLRNVISSESPRRAIDEKLVGSEFEKEMLLVLKIACFCTVDDPKERPDSKDVRVMLNQVEG